MNDQNIKITDKRKIYLEDEVLREENTKPNQLNQENIDNINDEVSKLQNAHMLSIDELNSNELMLFFLNITAQKAMQSLLSPPDKRNLAEARKFIDLFEVILNFNSNKWQEPQLEQLLRMQLTELRLQYAKFAPSN